MKVELSNHAKQQMELRNASEAEVLEAIKQGVEEPARKGRSMFRHNFAFNAEWEGKHYRTKQVAPIVVEDDATLIVVTVYVFYF